MYLEGLEKKKKNKKDIKVEGEMKVCMKNDSLSFAQMITKITKI
jgi:hypothetical protein